jgi:hypothetical protein
MASLYFWWPSRDSCFVAMVEPPVSFWLVVSYFFDHPLFTPPPLHHHCRGKIEDHGLGALAKANDYQRGAHRDKDSLRDCKKQIVQPVHKQIK